MIDYVITDLVCAAYMHFGATLSQAGAGHDPERRRVVLHVWLKAEYAGDFQDDVAKLRRLIFQREDVPTDYAVEIARRWEH